MIKITKKFLEQEYLFKNKSQYEISKELGLSRSGLQRYILKYNLIKNKQEIVKNIVRGIKNNFKNKYNFITKSRLQKLYIIQNWSQQKIAQYFKVKRSIIQRLIEKYYFLKKKKENIFKRISQTRFKTIKTKQKFTKEVLKDLYLDKNLSRDKVSKILKVPSASIQYWLKLYNLKKSQKKEILCREKTFYERFGGYPAQNTKLKQKIDHNGFKNKIYIFPSGQKVNIQGYEHFGINLLLKQGYKEKDIILDKKRIEKITRKFFWKDKKIHRYYPDIFIKSENRFIEIKSKWTNRKELNKNNFKKLNCVKEKGYNISLWEFNSCGNLTKEIIL